MAMGGAVTGVQQSVPVDPVEHAVVLVVVGRRQ